MTDADERLMLRRDLFFSKLLGSGSCGDLDILLRDAADLGISCSRRFHRIIVAELESWGDLISRTGSLFNPEDRSEANFVLTNICQTLFAMDGRCETAVTSYEGRLVFWIDADTRDCTDAMFQRAAGQTAALVEAEFSMVVTFSIGRWFEDLFHSMQEYRDVLNLLFYFRFLDEQGGVYTMDRLPEQMHFITFERSGFWSRRLQSAIQEGELDQIKSLLQDAYTERFLEPAVPLAVFPSRRAGFCELLESTAVELIRKYPAAGADADETVLALYKVETGRAQMEVLEDLTDAISICLQPEAKGPPPAWVGELAAFVQENYMDPGMTVYLLADQAGLTPSYCTRVFRRYMGVSLLEYIRKQRVSAAIAQLEAGKTMAQTAQAVGFTCTQTLRRTLKQYRLQLQE